MMQFLNGLVSQFNTLQGQVGNAILTPTTSNLGALSGNTSFNANGAQHVSVTFSFAVALTFTITNLPVGALLQMNMTNTSGAAKIITGVASEPNGTAYTSWLVDAPAAQKNLLTGWSFPVGTLFVIGVTMSDLSINQIAQ